MKYSFATMTMLSLLACGSIPALAANSPVESALAGRGDVSLFYQALLNTGVANELNENTEYTIFAPTNAAFAEIQPRVYPCFYSAQCRAGVAAVLRNHIVPRNESISRFSKWGGDIPTIGTRRLDVEEPFLNHYAVEGHSVLYQNRGEDVSLYPIDGVITSNQELAQFRLQPVASMPGTVTEKTVTTYRTPPVYPVVPGAYAAPGGYPPAPVVIYTAPGYAAPVYVAPDEMPDDNTQTTTTTVTHTTTTR